MKPSCQSGVTVAELDILLIILAFYEQSFIYTEGFTNSFVAPGAQLPVSRHKTIHGRPACVSDDRTQNAASVLRQFFLEYTLEAFYIQTNVRLSNAHLDHNRLKR